MSLKEKLKNGVDEIAGRAVTWDENLFERSIDSLALVGVINLIEDLAKSEQKKIDIDALISEDSLSLTDILNFIESAPTIS